MTGFSGCGGSTHWQQRADVVVIGTGVAGLVAGLAAHRRGRKVIVLDKAGEHAGATATGYAQGGIAVVLPGTGDSVDAHVADTLAAGGGLCDADAVHSIVADGYRAVRDLVHDGACFDEATPGQLALTREGDTRSAGSSTPAATPPAPRCSVRSTRRRGCSTSATTTWRSGCCGTTPR